MRTLVIATLGLLVGCGPNTAGIGGTGGSRGGGSGGAHGGGSGQGAGGSGAGTGGSANGGGSATGGGSGAGDGCSDDAKIIYVVDTDNTFSSFDPHTNTFNDLGTLDCTSGGTPFSMAIARDASAYVLYTTGEVFHVDTGPGLHCTKTAFTASASFTQFGMGFSTDAPGGTTDTLYIAGAATFGSNATLGSLDTTTFHPTTVGNVDGWPELTGTGSAQLWGFFPQIQSSSAMPAVAQLDKMTAQRGTQFTASSLAGNATDWAFAFWGGSFYIFLERDSDSSTIVWKMDGSTGTVTKAVNNTGRNIVGAGVSTCAPITIN